MREDALAHQTDQLRVDGRPLTRRALRQALRERRGARFYDQVGEYQADMLNRLGALNERFFDLFLWALTFQPIRDINSFVEQWLLDARPLAVAALQKALSPEEQLLLIASLAEKLRLSYPRGVKPENSTGQTSIMELHGLGKQIWQGVDAQQYVDDLRQEWDERQ